MKGEIDMDIGQSKTLFGLFSLGIIIMAFSLLIPWPITAHIGQFIVIVLCVIVLNSEYRKLIKFYSDNQKETT
jgi:hypothetical protein